MKLKIAGYWGLVTCIISATGIIASSNKGFHDVELISLSLLFLFALVSLALIGFSGKYTQAK